MRSLQSILGFQQLRALPLVTAWRTNTIVVSNDRSIRRRRRRRKQPRSVSSTQPTPAFTKEKDTRPHVAVLASSYAKSSSVHKQLDTLHTTPEHWVSPDFPYRFTFHDLHKVNCIEEVNKLISTGDIHCFFNLCDGAESEDRAGEEVIRALLRLNVPFTGTGLHSYEPSKVVMKMLVAHGGVKAPSFALLHQGQQNLARAIRHLRFPIFIKPVSGYGSCGITAESKCANMDEFLVRILPFLEKFQVALVEEFIVGREGTVLVCVDRKAAQGTHVCPPLLISIPGGDEGFLHIDAKWDQDSISYSTKPVALELNDPAYARVIDMAHNSFKLIMGEMGYGRIDFRIDRATNDPYFIEINANCALFYPRDAPDWGDAMLQYDKDWTHEDLITSQIEHAVADAASRRPWWYMVHNASRQFAAKALRMVPMGTFVFGDRTQPVVGVMARIMQRTGRSKRYTPRPGCMISRLDDPNSFITVRHSCHPNLAFLHGPSLGLVTKRPIRTGELLTVDFATLRDTTMREFACNCGSPKCRGAIRTQHPQLRQSPPFIKAVSLSSSWGSGSVAAQGSSENSPIARAFSETSKDSETKQETKVTSKVVETGEASETKAEIKVESKAENKTESKSK